jgi:hypothetical protein
MNRHKIVPEGLSVVLNPFDENLVFIPSITSNSTKAEIEVHPKYFRVDEIGVILYHRNLVCSFHGYIIVEYRSFLFLETLCSAREELLNNLCHPCPQNTNHKVVRLFPAFS